MLFLSYAIGLIFTLRTHAAVIWNTEVDEKKAERMAESTNTMQSHYGGRGATPTPFPTLSRQPTRTDVRESQLYRRILGQSLRQLGANESQIATPISPGHHRKPSVGYDTIPISEGSIPHVVPPKSKDSTPVGSPVLGKGIHIGGLSEEDNRLLQRQVAEMAATAATVAARDATRFPRSASQAAVTPVNGPDGRPSTRHTSRGVDVEGAHSASRGEGEIRSSHPPAAQASDAAAGASSGGHDAPNWSRTKSAVILLTATLAYAVIAEILVNTVDAVLTNVDIDEKFLGITLFALVPNTTEFLNAISFAMNGNIALSMEIGSAYALQVCLLQIPALVLFSSIHTNFINEKEVIDHTFSKLL